MIILREGTDYGLTERSFESKMAELTSRLKKGEVVLTYDAKLDSFNIVSSDELSR